MFKGQEIKVFNNFDDGILVCGSEDLPKNYLMLKDDEGIQTLIKINFLMKTINMDLGTLPETFTICSSLYVEYLTTFLNFFSIKDVSTYVSMQKFQSPE